MQPTTRTNDYHNNYYTTQLRNLQHTTILLTTNTPPEYYASLAPGFRPRDLAQVWPGDFARVWFPGFSLTALLSDWSGNIAPVHLNLGGLWWLPCRIIPGRVLILQREGYVVDFDFPLFLLADMLGVCFSFGSLSFFGWWDLSTCASASPVFGNERGIVAPSRPSEKVCCKSVVRPGTT